MERKALIFDKHCINKNAFHKNEKTIKTVSIDKVEIRRIALSKKDSYGKKVHLNILLDISMKLMLFQYHYE